MGPRGLLVDLMLEWEKMSQGWLIRQAWAIKKQACDVMGEWEESRILLSSRKRKIIVGRIWDEEKSKKDGNYYSL